MESGNVVREFPLGKSKVNEPEDGSSIDAEKIAPKLAEYMAKMLQGREPSALPYYYYSEQYYINLQTTSILGLEIPTDVIIKSTIVR